MGFDYDIHQSEIVYMIPIIHYEEEENSEEDDIYLFDDWWNEEDEPEYFVEFPDEGE